MSGKYDDIINLPHHVSTAHKQMPREKRAAQFSPFAALTGYEEAIKETARVTDERMELEEDAKAALDMKLHMLGEALGSHPHAVFTHFVPDEKKHGGKYVETCGEVLKIDIYRGIITLEGGERIAVDDIAGIESNIFSEMM